jgi:hypothetical protein
VADFLLRSQQTDATARPEACALEQHIKAVTRRSFDVAMNLFMSIVDRGREIAKVTGTFHRSVRAVSTSSAECEDHPGRRRPHRAGIGVAVGKEADHGRHTSADRPE